MKEKEPSGLIERFAKNLTAFAQSILKEQKEETSPKAVLTLQDATGTEIVFEALSKGDNPAKGDSATIDGKAAKDGTYIMPSLANAEMSIKGGKVDSIKEPDIEASEKPDNKDKKKPVEAKVESVQEITMYTIEIVNETFEEGDTVYRKGWDNEEYPLSASEFLLKDGRSVVTDASGKIVTIKEPVSEITEASEKPEKLKELIALAVEKAIQPLKETLSEKETEITALKAKISSPEYQAEQREAGKTDQKNGSMSSQARMLVG